MKELKPKLILPNSRKGENRSNLRLLLIFILAFILGVYAGVNLKDINIDEFQLTQKKENRPSDTSTDIQSEKAYFDENFEGEDKDSDSKELRTNLSQMALTINLASTGPTDTESKKNKPETVDLIEPESKEDSSKVNKSNVEESINKQYTLQIAAFKTMERAEMGANELKGKGYDVYIIPTLNSKEENWNLVRIGKFKTTAEAENFAATLQQREGIKAIVKELD